MREWYAQDFGVDWNTVLGLALPILNRYTGRTNGSSIRYRDPSVAWSYYRTIGTVKSGILGIFNSQ